MDDFRLVDVINQAVAKFWISAYEKSLNGDSGFLEMYFKIFFAATFESSPHIWLSESPDYTVKMSAIALQNIVATKKNCLTVFRLLQCTSIEQYQSQQSLNHERYSVYL